ncbi:MAG: aldehyde dehydrogenase family protein [Acidimicrobiales bacterium]
MGGDRTGAPAGHALSNRRRTVQRRAELLGAMVHEGRKTIAEADPEISEGIDFARWYSDAWLDLASDQWTDDGALCFEPMGVIAVVPPWNFRWRSRWRCVGRARRRQHGGVQRP